MDKWQAQQLFWSSFGWPTYDENTVITDEEPEYPHITYQAQGGAMDQQIATTASLWDRSMSWERLSKKADEIGEALKSGVILKIDGGYLWFKMPAYTPYAQRMASGGDEEVKRIYLTVEAECLTEY